MKRFSRKIKLRLEMCSTCMKMCRDNCPTAIASCSESLTPYNRSLNINLNEKGIRAYDERALEIIFSCLTCNLCNSFCLPRVDEAELIELARASIVESGIDVSRYNKISESISNHHNPLNENHKNRTDSFNEIIPRGNDADTVLFIGCMISYREVEIAKASIELLKKLNIKFKIINEWCCGSPVIKMGFFEPAMDVINHNISEFSKSGTKNIITPCSTCYKTIKSVYPKYISDFDFNVQHTSELIKTKLYDIQLKSLNSKVTYHDPCHLGRGMGIYDEIREILNKVSEVVEMDHTRDKSFCCGAGGGVRTNFPDLAQDIGILRVDEAIRTGADYLISACPLCKYHFKNCVNIGDLEVLDIVELINQLL
ncbi:MAG: (Fe-S)-binding protein [Promethearchaeota archaeon]